MLYVFKKLSELSRSKQNTHREIMIYLNVFWTMSLQRTWHRQTRVYGKNNAGLSMSEHHCRCRSIVVDVRPPLRCPSIVATLSTSEHHFGCWGRQSMLLRSDIDSDDSTSTVIHRQRSSNIDNGCFDIDSHASTSTVMF